MSTEKTEPERIRTVRWQDPMIGARRATTMSGLEYMRSILKGEVSMAPIGLMLDIRLIEAEEGRIVLTVDPAEYHYNPIGSVHGGVISTLLDSAMGCAIHTLLPQGTGYSTVDLHLNFVRPITAATGTVRAEGKSIHLGKRFATAEGRVVDGDGKLYAHSTTTCLILS
ncbi:MAG TPA: PaaI family thioesterase [Pseudomonadota bacterium]|nr:PaaI family thioesterase [Pseudomonadota bacterium]